MAKRTVRARCSTRGAASTLEHSRKTESMGSEPTLGLTAANALVSSQRDSGMDARQLTTPVALSSIAGLLRVNIWRWPSATGSMRPGSNEPRIKVNDSD